MPNRSPRREPIDRLRPYFQEFLRQEASGGILLMLCSVAALVWANSAVGETYARFWDTRLAFDLGGHGLSKPLLLWVNDGLMAIFFFVVGLEIKREILVGELSSLRQAALPLVAAIGGMAVPALLYVGVNRGLDSIGGWGVPMATDIAFALSVLVLLGDRVPASAKVFLTAIAIVDDIGATLVIALFYTESISLVALAAGGGFLGLMLLANRLGIRNSLVYAILGLGLWVAVLKSGVHPTIAGVLGAMTIPARTRIDSDHFLERGRALLERFARAGQSGESVLTNPEQRAALHALEHAAHDAQSPLQVLEHTLHPGVTFVVMPVFALANAGLTLGPDAFARLASPPAVGIIAGLVLGKPLGILAFSLPAVRARLADLPEGLSWSGLLGLGCLAGIGFTMSLFLAGLAFPDAAALSAAKAAILAASLASAAAGTALLLRGTR